MADSDSDSIIDELMREHRQLMKYLQSTGDISLQSRVNSNFAKILLLSAASYFENRITSSVIQVFQQATSDSSALVSFVKSKAISRRYHEWFAWGTQNANHFSSAFGEDFLEFMKIKLMADSDISDSIQAFMELGRRRNELVHGNYAIFPLNKTVDEVYELYVKANRFVDLFPNHICEHIGIPLIPGQHANQV